MSILTVHSYGWVLLQKKKPSWSYGLSIISLVSKVGSKLLEKVSVRHTRSPVKESDT